MAQGVVCFGAKARGETPVTERPEQPAPDRAHRGAQAAVARVVRNTGLRAAAELTGKVLTLGVLAALARADGAGALGILIFGLAWAEVASLPVDMGFDRHLQRLIVRDRTWIDRGFFNVLRMKSVRAIVVVPASFGLLFALGYNGTTAVVVAATTVTYLAESVRWTTFGVFTAFERGDLVAATLLAQRIGSGLLGVGALIAGWGVVGVALAYAVAALLGSGFAYGLLSARVARPQVMFPREPRQRLKKGSVPFAAQEYLSAGIARVDTILLSLLTTNAVVGIYGGAYRLFESTVFISVSLLGAVSAMFTYLDDHSDPTVGAAFGRAIKLSFALLLPCTLVMVVLPGELLELFFGSGFDGGEQALRTLAPAVVLLGMVMLSGSLIASRLDPRILLRRFAVGFAVNIVANLALIPPYEETGAAIAMLITEITLAAMLMPLAIAEVGRPSLPGTFGSALIAGGVMSLALVLFSGTPAMALVIGGVLYAATFLVVERRVAPRDLAAMGALLRGRGAAGSRAERGSAADARKASG